MARRNGQGPRGLNEVTEKFRRGEHRLIKLLEEEGLISDRERDSLLQQVSQSVSQKRAGEMLNTAHTVHNKIIQVLRRGKAPVDARERTELEVLYEVTRLTQCCDDGEKVFARLLELICAAIPYEHGTVFLMSGDPPALKVASSHGPVVDLIPGVKFDLGFGFSSWVAKQRKPILLTELHRGMQAGGMEVGSFLSVPMIVQNELIGVINLSHPREKGFTEDHLRLLVLIAGQAASVIQRILMYENMQRLAITDELTGLTNRRHFLQRLDAEIERARRYEYPFSIVMIDIDHFKRINDAHGHVLGDRVLADMGKLLRKIARGSDLPARYGGEEFVILMPMTDAERAFQACERIRAAVEEHIFPRRKKLTVSLGLSTFPFDAAAAPELVRRADLAMYTAKRDGRNRTVLPQRAAA